MDGALWRMLAAPSPAQCALLQKSLVDDYIWVDETPNAPRWMERTAFNTWRSWRQGERRFRAAMRSRAFPDCVHLRAQVTGRIDKPARKWFRSLRT